MSRTPDPVVLADSRQRLIQAAAEAFRQEGYRASIDRIAERAGVARQTVYNHFPSKEDLFSEVARIAADAILVSLDSDEGDLRAHLVRFAMAFRQRLLGDAGLAMFRTLSAEVPRFPTLGQAFFDKGPRQTLDGLTSFLAVAMHNGQLRHDDPAFAAETLIGMLCGIEHMRRLFCMSARTSDADGPKATKIVDCFLGAFAVQEQQP